MRSTHLPGLPRALTNLCVGTSPLGYHMTEIYGGDVEDRQAHETIAAALESPIRFLDTANGYGESERRIGEVLATSNIADDFVVATKAAPRGTDFSGSRVKQSLAESTSRLGLDSFDVYYLHDPERFEYEYLTGRGGAVDALRELKGEGSVRAIGVAGGDIATLQRYLRLDVFDVVLNHNRFTLLDRTADPLIDETLSAGAAFINAAPYASGLLAKSSSGRYKYRLPDDRVTRLVHKLTRVCADYAVSLPAVALRFSTRDPRITSTVVGVSRPQRIAELVENDAADIPEEIWCAIEMAVAEG